MRAKRNKIKKFISLLLVVCMMVSMMPTDAWASESSESEQTTEVEETSATATEAMSEVEEETQVTEIETTSEAEETSETEQTSESEPVTEPEETGETTQEESEKGEETTAYDNSISGMLWLDMFDDADNGIYAGDGVRQTEELPLVGYTVNLYKKDDLSNAVQTTKTDANGKYEFTDIEPGSYVVGIPTETKDGVEYLLPLFWLDGTTGDNRFVATQEDPDDEESPYSNAYTAPIMVDEDTVVTDMDTGMRTVPGAQTMADYTINIGTITTSGTGYTYSGGVLTFTTAANSHTYTITGSSTSGKYIVVGNGVTANITLSGATISNTVSPFRLLGTAKVNLTLNGTNTLTCTGTSGTLGVYQAGLYVAPTAALTIDGTGALNASGGGSSAGIGGSYLSASDNGAGTINISSGTVTATSGISGAGIGGGRGGNGGTVNISGGTVTATSVINTGFGGAGIGGGYTGNGGTTTISGGTVNATGSHSGAGIGGGNAGDVGVTTISGGTVTATGGSTVGSYSGAGIGGGWAGGISGTIEISGGTVNAIGGSYSAGIGNSRGSHGVTITITGGTVTATGGGIDLGSGVAMDIGFGSEYSGVVVSDSIVITGGSVLPTRGASYVANPTNGTANGNDPVGMFTFTQFASQNFSFMAGGTLGSYTYSGTGHAAAAYPWTAYPAVTTDAATNMSSTAASVTAPSTINTAASSTATLNGTYYLNNTYALTSAYFEWGTTTGYGSTQAVTVTSAVAIGIYPVASSALTGLLPSTTYHYRLVIKTGTGGAVTVYGDDVTFTTPALVPSVDVTHTFGGSNVTLNGIYDLNGGIFTSGLFEISTDGGTTWSTPTGGTLTGGTTTPTVSLTGLSAGTYQYRITVTNSVGTTQSSVGSFTLQAITVSFDPQGGTPAPSAVTYLNTDTLGTLPTGLTQTGYTFNGWYTAATGGTQVSSSDVVGTVFPGAPATGTLYARWTPVSVPITVNYEDGSGTAISSSTPTSTSANFGASFTATDPTFTGYILSDVKIGGVPQGNTNLTITSISTLSLTITLVYAVDSSQTASIGVEYYFDGVIDSSKNITITPQILSTVNQSDVVLATTPTGYMLAPTPTAPVLSASASSLNGGKVMVYYITDPSQTASIDVEYYFDGTHVSSYDTTITPQILASVTQGDVALGTVPTGYMIAATPTAPTLPASASSLDGSTVSVYYVTDPSQMANIDVNYYFDGIHNSSYDATITPQILSMVAQGNVVLTTTPTGYMLAPIPISVSLPASAASLDGSTINVYYVADSSQTASINIEYYFDGVLDSSKNTTITPQILATVTQSDVVLGTIPTGYMLDTPSTNAALPASASSLNSTTVQVYYVADPSQTATIDIEYYFDGVHNSSYDQTITPQILTTVTQADIVLATTPMGYILDITPSSPSMPATATSLDGSTVKVYYITNTGVTASIDIEYYFDSIHDSSYDTTITPQILAIVNQNNVVLATTPTGYMLDATPTNPAMPATASSLDGTTVSVYYVTDPSQTASIDIEYYFDGVHDSSYDQTLTPQILTSVIQSDVVLATTPIGYMLDATPTAPLLPDSAINLDGTTVKVYYVIDPSQMASIDVEYYFDGTHDSSYDATITPQILGNVNQSNVVLATTPIGYMLDTPATAPALPDTAINLDGTTVTVYYVTDPSQVASIDVEYYFDGVYDSSYDATITPQILGSVNQSNVVLATTPIGYMLDAPATAPTLPDTAINLDGTTVTVYYVTDPSQTASIDVEYYFDGVHDSTYDATITPQILSTVNQSNVVLTITSLGYMLDTPATVPTLPDSAINLDGTTVTVYYVIDPSQVASIDVEYYFDGTHNSSYDATVTPQILGTVNQSNVVLATMPIGYMLDTPATAPALPDTAINLDGTTVIVYYVTDPSWVASIDVEYYFDGVHNSSYDATITPQILTTVNQSGVVLATTPIGYMLNTVIPTVPLLPASALSLDGTTVTVFYISVTPPVINPVGDMDSVVTGTGISGDIITVTWPDGTQDTTTVQPGGSWNVSVPGTVTLVPGDIITATATDPAGNTSLPDMVTVYDSSAPVINPVGNTDSTVTGTGNPGDTITVTWPDGTQDTTIVKPDGSWDINIPGTVTLQPGDIITATATDSANNVSNPGTAIVYDTTPPVINPVGDTDSVVTGTGNPGDTITVTWPDGTQDTTTVSPGGTWTVPVPPTPLNPGDTITAESTDPAGNTSNPGTVTVYDTTPPVIDPVGNTDSAVTGTGNPGDTITVTWPDGTQDTATVQPDGTWDANVPGTVTLQHGDIITAVATDPAGNASNPGTATVYDTTPPVINPVGDTDSVVTGTGNPGDTITVTWPDGTQDTTIVSPGGSWTVPTPGPLNPGDTITAEATDPAGNASNPGTATVYDTTPPVINPVGNTDSTVTGTGNPGDTITVTWPNGTQDTATVQPDGSWNVNVPGTVTLLPGDIITAVATDPAGNNSNPGTVTVGVTVTVEYVDRNLNPIGISTIAAAPHSSSFTATDPTFVGYVLADWSFDGGVTLQGNTTATIGSVTTNITITLIYGQDSNGNGTEDITITKDFVDASGTAIQASQTVIVDVGTSFTDAHDAITGYTYTGYQAGGILTAAPAEPSIAVVPGDTDFTVTYYYSANSYNIKVEYELRDGTSVPGMTDYTTSCVYGTQFTPVTPVLTGYILGGWKLNGISMPGTLPSITVPAANITITVIYGCDNGSTGQGSGSGTPDGIEDILVTKEFLKSDGTILQPSQIIIVNMGDIFADVHDTLTGYDYEGYQIDGGSLQTGEPSLFIGAITRMSLTTTVHGNSTVSYVYKPTQYSIKVGAVDENGSSIASGVHDWTASKGYQEEFKATAPTIQGYVYQNWKLNGIVQSGDIVIASVEANQIIQLVYQKEKATPTPEPIPDAGNYEFIKMPNVREVKTGETVKYTFTGFGNNWNVPLEKYEISDKPDKGLDFVSADIPAFTNGTGVTYDVVYYTNQQGRTVLHANVPADKAFSFKAPALAAGEYITGLNLVFSTVPAGFGVGDSLTMTFKVWDNPPSKSLTNIGILSYYVDGVYKNFVTGGASGTVVIGGYFGTPATSAAVPKTSDTNDDISDTILLMISALFGIMLLLSLEEKKSRKKKA